ncbi:putative phosphoribosylformylglycinamidine synthase [Rosa chinensis]|uniref:Putative phosphoribosylformylglycinamidine synthase n=1 Tax=Rosa chinensis TaxID=74649 RepID=A0A2P6PF35_ROSCH|nr:putative phosphoribosylformylglycinamidine synthase [Rosa chinensis]
MVGVLLRDLKFGDDGVLLHIDLGCRKAAIRWLCSFLIVNNCPDLEDVPYLKQVFEGVQCLLDDELVSGGHDISDGGLLVYAVKMAFAGNCGINLDESTFFHKGHIGGSGGQGGGCCNSLWLQRG